MFGVLMLLCVGLCIGLSSTGLIDELAVYVQYVLVLGYVN